VADKWLMYFRPVMTLQKAAPLSINSTVRKPQSLHAARSGGSLGPQEIFGLKGSQERSESELDEITGVSSLHH
jgi:hypothetical protein